MAESDAGRADLSALKIDRDTRSRPPGRRKRWLHLLWLLLPVAAYLVYQNALVRVAPTTMVRVATVQRVTGSEATAELVATGYVVAQVKAAVSSKATGRLRVLNVEEGDSVRSGDVIAELENDDIRADLDLIPVRYCEIQFLLFLPIINIKTPGTCLYLGRRDHDLRSICERAKQ